ncbi:hypothetical protein F7D01_01275 [Erythrobacter sp. 3-20A1M]|uniref:hypothetical protein n=1 Tax=Erythrobacter sp. 3-20A1M TaxID=2653850 RepID=UPI001BFCB429|nr:hypothetical protein [Erythrobacter sp. 3-20A1M]QWC55900.1 hypothetical protein F7D01_01275 [Erythrobacter sp. 3-20A1M]
MKFYYAAARSVAPSPVVRALSRRASARAANDNGNRSQNPATDPKMVNAALRHFSQHGLHAASRAAEEAETAFFAGDRERYEWWRGICKTLDRRLAEELADRFRSSREMTPA